MTEKKITLTSFSPAAFSAIFQGGFRVKARVGVSVREFLCGQSGVSGEYLEKRISTIFLDGKPVDDVDAAIMHDGATLSLSASMPGLVGATMRRGGFYAAFRGSISYRENGAEGKKENGMVRVKLFNLIREELGPVFLLNGIYVDSDELLDSEELLHDAGGMAVIDHAAVDPDDFWNGLRADPHRPVFIVLI